MPARRTSHRALLPSDDELFTLLQQNITDHAILVLDLTGRVARWTHGARVLLGYAEDEILGHPLSFFFTAEDQQQGLPARELTAAAADGYAGDENWLVRKDGSRFWASGSTTALRDAAGHLRAYVKIVNDLTAQKELDQRKDAFISLASHELKTPLTALKGFTQILQGRARNRGDAEVDAILSRIDSHIDRLTALINDILDVSRIHQGQLDFRHEVFPIDPLVQELLADLQPLYGDHRIVLEGQTSAPVLADRDRTTQVVMNLLDNAVKYSPRADTVIVRLAQDAQTVTISVQDFGLGIPVDQQAKVFERFYRATTNGAQFPGLGLGLFVAATIVEHQGGRIWVDSTAGKGSTFFFTVPRAAG